MHGPSTMADAVTYVTVSSFCHSVFKHLCNKTDGLMQTLQRRKQTVTDLWEWMERPRWYSRGVPPRSLKEMTPKEREEWVKAIKRCHDEAVSSTKEEEG